MGVAQFRRYLPEGSVTLLMSGDVEVLVVWVFVFLLSNGFI